MTMKIRWFFIIAVALMILSLHYGTNAWQYSHMINKWATASHASYFRLYLTHQDYFLGLSYSSAGGFLLFSFFRFLQNRRKGAVGMIGGTALMAGIYWGGCFLIGCCGSPMLAVYLGLFGSSFLGFAKPMIFIITALSIIVSAVFGGRDPRYRCSDGYCSSKY